MSMLLLLLRTTRALGVSDAFWRVITSLQRNCTQSFFSRHSPDRQPIYLRLVGRIALRHPSSSTKRHQEVGFLPERTSMAARAYYTAPYPRIKRHFGRTSSVRLRSDCVRLRAQHRATCLGRSSSIIARMRLNRLRGTATSAIWNTV